MLTFLTNDSFFKSPLNIFNKSLFKNHSRHNDLWTSPMQESIHNDKVMLMKTPNRDLEVQRKKKTFASPKVIVNRLNIMKTDNILIIGNKIYIEQTEMTRLDKLLSQDLVVRGGKTYYFGYQNTKNANVLLSASGECSLLCDKNKTQIKTCMNNARNGSADSYIKPLRQINGNVKPADTVIHSGVDGQEMPSISEVTSFYSHDQSLKKYDRDYLTSYIQKKKCNGILLGSVLPKQHKRLNKNSPASLFRPLKSVLSARNLQSPNASQAVLKSYKPFHNWCNYGKQNYPNGTRTNILKSPRKCLSGHKVSPRLKGPSQSCKLQLERVDAKLCFMNYLGLKPTVKTDIKKMCELSLLRKFNIRNCHVVILRAPIATKRKR